MSNALERWRERCRWAIETGDGAPPFCSPATYFGCLRDLLSDTEHRDDPEDLATDLGLMAMLAMSCSGGNPVGHTCALAMSWLLEELDKEGK